MKACFMQASLKLISQGSRRVGEQVPLSYFLINGPVVDTGLDRVTEYTNGCNGPFLFLQPYLSTFIFN